MGFRKNKNRSYYVQLFFPRRIIDPMTLVKCANLTQGRKIVNALREKKGRPCVVCSRSTRQETTDWAGTFFKKRATAE